MKEYKYTINGNKYNVTIAGIEDNIANVVVNGEEYKVEMEKEPEPVKKKVVVKPVAAPVPAEAPASGNGTKVNVNNAVHSRLVLPVAAEAAMTIMRSTSDILTM